MAASSGTASPRSCRDRDLSHGAAGCPRPEADARHRTEADGAGLTQPSDEESRDLLDRYMAAFTAMDVEALMGTLREDALLQMPPFPQWFLGRDAIGEFLITAFARGGSFRCTQTRANGQLAVGVYRRRNSDAHRFLHVQLITVTATGIARIDAFHVPDFSGRLGLPEVLAN